MTKTLWERRCEKDVVIKSLWERYFFWPASFNRQILVIKRVLHRMGAFNSDAYFWQLVSRVHLFISRILVFTGLQAQFQPRFPTSSEAYLPPKNFLRLPGGNGCILESEEWKDQNTTLYRPLSNDVMINLRSVEQLSFASGTFFVADEHGVYKASQEGGNMFNLYWLYWKHPIMLLNFHLRLTSTNVPLFVS